MARELDDAEIAVRMEELIAACRLREETVRQPGNCIHQAWHDLKESMHVVRVAGTLLRAKAADDDARGIADFVISASNDLHHLLIDLPDYARLEAGRETCNIAPFNAAVVFRDAADAVRPALQAKNVVLNVTGGPLPVHGDFGKTQRIVENLIRYSLKLTRPTEIGVTWAAQSPERWSFMVRSTSAATENLPVLPERISLSVARCFCTILGGTLNLEIAAGAVRFHVDLPASYSPS